ncbi:MULTISPECIES: crotonase/enoyl-CoA hydratase family protein [Aeromicrobium]|uniref:crotonase/enoyl-CoA hydratase family protein n=1 Tax=Aeromicrobium TaxID=2040 RepID=UPI00257A5550|nr:MULTISPECIES: crotonase/enoyl-CoA hydratase family protein [Aeromicrobium]
MTEQHVVTEIEGPIARVWLNRPDKLNGITFGVLDGLLEAADRIEADPNVRAVLLEGRGPSFCAGLDFAQVMTDKKRVARYFMPNPLKGTNKFQQPLWAWRELSVPVIAVTRGHVFGGGIQLALGADFRFTTPDCQWSIMEAKWGLVPDMSGTVALAELVGADLAKRLVMTGEVFSGEQAVEYGIASGVAEDPTKPALELIDQLLARSPDSVAASKRLLNETRLAKPRRAFALERKYQRAMLKSPNTDVARKAGMAKTEPEFGPRRFGR